MRTLEEGLQALHVRLPDNKISYLLTHASDDQVPFVLALQKEGLVIAKDLTEEEFSLTYVNWQSIHGWRYHTENNNFTLELVYLDDDNGTVKVNSVVVALSRDTEKPPANYLNRYTWTYRTSTAFSFLKQVNKQIMSYASDEIETLDRHHKNDLFENDYETYADEKSSLRKKIIDFKFIRSLEKATVLNSVQ